MLLWFLLFWRLSHYFGVLATTSSLMKYVPALASPKAEILCIGFQFNPDYEFTSHRAHITLQLADSYEVRNEILGQLHRNAYTWFELALGRAPIELQSTLQVCVN